MAVRSLKGLANDMSSRFLFRYSLLGANGHFAGGRPPAYLRGARGTQAGPMLSVTYGDYFGGSIDFG